MQGRAVFGGIRSTACLGESNLSIQYLYLNDTRPEVRKKGKKCADFCENGTKEGAIKQFFNLRLDTVVKIKDLHGQYILP